MNTAKWQITAKTIYCDAVGDEVTILVHKDWSLTPITNVSENREQLITPTGPEYSKFVELLFAGKLFGWAHSHPRWAPWPSRVDLEFHQFPIHMLIYSISEDQFGLFSPSDLTAIEHGQRPPSRYRKFKNPVTQGIQSP